MLIVILFSFVFIIWASMLLGAHLYHAGSNQQSPGIKFPKFKRNSENHEREVNRLPDV